MSKQRIGILGGTFDPIHDGHIQMALSAINQLKLDMVLMIPCHNPDYKKGVTDDNIRWEMLCTACSPYEKLVPSRIELDRSETTYTYDTLRQLNDENPKNDYFFLLGADKLINICNWYRFQDMCTPRPLCHFVVFSKCFRYSPDEINGTLTHLTSVGAKVEVIDAETVNISSSEIRSELSKGRLPKLLPCPVLEYCLALGVYSHIPRIQQFEKWHSMLFEALNIDRFAHTLAVAYTARNLAVCHNVDPEKAEIAGLLHDCAKCMPTEEQQKMCKEYNLTDDPSIMETGRLMHGIVGAFIASSKYGMHDPDILRAIACHTTGKVEMTKLDMIVFIADKIEPTRKSYPALEKMRSTARVSLERAVLMSIDSTAEYVKSSGKKVHPASAETAEWLKSVIKK